MYGSEMIAYWSAWHWIMFTLFAVLFIYPIGIILRRIGYSPFWCLLALLPLFNIIGLWLLAISPWPSNEGRRR